MNIILLSGGSGKRLWPLSNEVRSKQFLKIFKDRDGNYESMLQRVYRQLNDIGIQTNVTVATSKNQVSAVYEQLGTEVDCCIEPCRKDTFPAIALSAAYLVDVKGVKPTEAVVVCPVDPLVTNEYFRALIALQYQAEMEMSNIVLMGIVPTYPADEYGYILPEGEKKLSSVKFFKEKPTREMAEEYIRQGALWNGGVFAFQLQYILSKAKELLGYNKYDELLAHYNSFQEVSFDYAVAEKEKSIQVMRFSGEWMDMGTWNTLSNAMSDAIVGKGVIDETSTGVQIVNETDVPILAMGLHNIVISASPEGILVSDKETSPLIKSFVDDIGVKEKAAGNASGLGFSSSSATVPETGSESSVEYRKVIDAEEGSRTIKFILKAGQSTEYHSHLRRDEIWIVVNGEGQVTLEGKKNVVKKGDIITVKAGCKHVITANTDMILIEIQLGSELSGEDKMKFDLA